MRIPVGAASLILAAALANGMGLPCHADPSDGTVTVRRSGSEPSRKGPPANFTGAVRVDPMLKETPPSRMSGGLVTFEPGARTAWHSHPLGQTLIVTAGLGLVQQWGGPIQEIRPGDVVRIPPGVKHWHGASATAGMSHVAIVEAVDGKTADWMEHVTDAQYRGE
jgi:quercetin dioxygenase-like cupin family protein